VPIQSDLRVPSGGSFGDSLAILVSSACLIHCLALPLVLALLPAWSIWLDPPESFHLWVVMLASPLSLFVLIRAAQGRLDFAPLWLGITGLCLMALALAVTDPVLEPLVTSVGALSLVLAHVLNWRSRRRADGC
jgi:hypothetical protein